MEQPGWDGEGKVRMLTVERTYTVSEFLHPPRLWMHHAYSGTAAAQETYSSPQELWQRVNGDKERDWYAPAVAHWDKQPATYDGVLAGLGHLNGCDIAESRTFLKKAFAKQLAAAAAGERRLVGLGAGGSAFLVMTAAQVSDVSLSTCRRFPNLLVLA